MAEEKNTEGKLYTQSDIIGIGATILGVIVLIVLKEAGLLPNLLFLLLVGVIVLYPIMRVALAIINAWLYKPPEKMGALKLYRLAVEEIRDQGLPWGYPKEYIPRKLGFLPAFGFLLFMVSKRDLGWRVSEEQTKNVDWEGTMLFDPESRKLYDAFEGWEFEQTIQYMKDHKEWFEKKPGRKVMLPAFVKETQIGGMG